MTTKIMSVESASYYVQKTLPPILVISAYGKVPTSGWTNGGLSPYVYINPPQDGIQDFDFVADAPEGIVLTVISPIAAEWKGEIPDWVRGFRIHSSTNSIEIAFGKQPQVEEDMVIRSPDVPWPRRSSAG